VVCMKKTKIIILISVCLLFGLCFLWIRSPISLGEVMRKLDSYLETDYKYISTYKSDDKNIEGIVTVTYQFEDINGVEFYVLTFPRFGDYDSSQPGYPRCDYLTAYYEFNKESIEKALQCGLPVTWANTGIYSTFRIEVSSYDELEILAPAVEKALNTFAPLVSENYSDSVSDKFEFYIPELSIMETGKNYNIISIFNFRLIKGQTPWTQEEILDKLQRDYKSKVL